jgi:hypothetical protein
MVDRIVHRNELRKTLSWLLQFFAAAAQLPQKPRRRAGETLARFRAVGGPIASTPAPPPTPVKPPDEVPVEAGARAPYEPGLTPGPNGAPAPHPDAKPSEAPEEAAEPKPGGSAAFPADQEIPIRE